jgi:hypothetical protein
MRALASLARLSTWTADTTSWDFEEELSGNSQLTTKDTKEHEGNPSCNFVSFVADELRTLLGLQKLGRPGKDSVEWKCTSY